MPTRWSRQERKSYLVQVAIGLLLGLAAFVLLASEGRGDQVGQLLDPAYYRGEEDNLLWLPLTVAMTIPAPCQAAIFMPTGRECGRRTCAGAESWDP